MQKNTTRTSLIRIPWENETSEGSLWCKKASSQTKLHHWCQLGIQSKVEEMAHYRGMRIRKINPKNTSALAFDGSDEGKRNNSRDLATFQSGKIYHADLNASYNIGARYFIREILKSFSEKKRLAVQAKVPELLARTQQTLASLINLHQALSINDTKIA
ncbi:zinc ribbon domain-containing protein [Pseudogracilibacillus sp. SO30301A]|uniref:zinc ribbon domain-containing protein n=1 Tax=Pseudogracilibacillus sp. SO30301A TaxID=3098291 RepID=UPI00300E3561